MRGVYHTAMWSLRPTNEFTTICRHVKYLTTSWHLYFVYVLIAPINYNVNNRINELKKNNQTKVPFSTKNKVLGLDFSKWELLLII